ncbi:MAG: amino acid adenylation domain-containing protein [Granulosicoccus sp.]
MNTRQMDASNDMYQPATENKAHFLPRSTVTDWLQQEISVGHQAALCFQDSQLDYNTLHARSNQVAHFLRASGIGKGHSVGLNMKRSVELIIAMVGILKSGAAYVPMDPEYPSSRLNVMAEEAGIDALFTHEQHAGVVSESLSGSVFIWERIELQIRKQVQTSLLADIDPEDTAYIIFTSGSTGRPKGVQMPHRALSNLIEWQLNRATFKPRARVLQYSTVSFDVSFQEIATTLASGGTLYLIDDESRKDPRRLLETLQKYRIQRLFVPYVAMRSLVEATNVAGTVPSCLKEIITAGEQLRIDPLVRSFFTHIGNASLDNQYGPSETHVITAKLLSGDPAQWPDLPSIGKPITNNDVYVMDEELNILADGYVGELYLHGRNVASGYVHRPEQTKASFIYSPIRNSHVGVLYKSGDLGFRNKAGELELLGRADHQIKIRGHRVEPAEINAVAELFDGVASSLTRVIERAGTAPMLATYVTARADSQAIDTQGLRKHLVERLPEHMVPTYLLELDNIPYTPSGKVDLNALPVPRADAGGEKPDFNFRSRIESTVADIWKEVIGIDKVPRNINFFDLGGDSLRAVKLFLGIQQQFGIDLPLSSLSHANTVAAIAQLVQGEDEHSSLPGLRCLHMIQPGDDLVSPLFLIHGGAGNILIFDKLAQQLDPRVPVYGFQWSGWDGGKGDSSITSIAAAYKAELLKFKPQSSYRLGGHCVGGIIALELAKQLQEDGYQIDGPVFVSDSPNLHSRHYSSWEPEDFPDVTAQCENVLAETLRLSVTDTDEWELRGVRAPHKNSRLAKKLKANVTVLKIVRWFKDLPELAQFHFARLENKLVLLTGGRIAIDRRPYYSASSLWHAINRHKATGAFKGDVVYFRSSATFGRNMALKGCWNDVFMGFEELVDGHFEGHVVGFGHNEVVQHPYVAKTINQYLGDS